MLATQADVSAVELDGTSQQAVTVRGDRRGLWIYNDSSAIIYVKLGGPCSPTDFSVKVESGDLLELPEPVFAGQVYVSGAAGTGHARVTDLY